MMTSTADPDYWSLLGLSPDAGSEQLKRAFRREARRWHPDLNGNDPLAEERFKLVNEAYAVLSDPRRRRAWERGGDGLASQHDPFAQGFPDFEEYLESCLGRPFPDPIGNPQTIEQRQIELRQPALRPIAVRPAAVSHPWPLHHLLLQ